MPLKTKRRVGRPKKFNLLRSQAGRIMRKTMRFAPKVHKIKELAEPSGSAITAAANATTNGIITFQVNELNNFPAIKALYDLYKIVGVKITLMPQWSVAPIGQGGSSTPGTQAGLPIMFIAPNRSPYSTAPTSEADVLNDDGVRCIRLSKPVSMYLKYPKPLLVADAEGTPGNLPIYNNNVQAWLSTGGNAQVIDQSAQKHYGFRYWLDNVNYGGNATVRVIKTYYLKLKEQD